MQALILIGPNEAAARPELLRRSRRLHQKTNALAYLQPFERPNRAPAPSSGLLAEHRQGSAKRRCRKAQDDSGRTRQGVPHQLPRTACTASRSSEYARGSSALNLVFRYFTLPSGPMTYTVRRLYPAASLLAYCFDTL